ncbi:heterokaryon incompatibility protein [Colletotrichum incanum]|uniref:Heterokaryon incompatibility protein n=1 Tax=Colletotrichum incanum TaxID=1573173 RepID=A0A162N8J1_COLIC|nr:heterokaryon incompatibility protein [Colletotrichum incanum]
MSYAWGPEQPTASIFLNGTEIDIRVNLAAGLRRFRTMDYFKRGGNIWIDALCIDHSDETEKASQIPLMGSIYKLAANVIVWLGPETDGSSNAIDTLQKLSSLYRTEYIETFDRSDPFTATAWRQMAQIRLRTSFHKLKALYSQLDLETDEDDFHLSSAWVERECLLFAAPTSHNGAQCYHLHDYIYGLLSIPGLPDLGLTVDYTKHITTVLTDFAAACVTKSKSLELFSLIDGCGMPVRDAQGNLLDRKPLPSWVPYLARTPEQRIGTIEGNWHASGNKQGFVFDGYNVEPRLREGNVLACYGFIAEVVDGVGAVSKPDMDTGSYYIPEFQAGTVQPRGEYTSKSEFGPEAKHDFVDMESPQNRVAKTLAGGPRLSWVLTCGADVQGIKQSFDCLYEAFPGLLGLALILAQPGDAVMVLVGHGRPVIARRFKDEFGEDTPLWDLIGEASVNGMMEWEMMDRDIMSGPKKIKQINFV